MGWRSEHPASATRLALIGSEIGEFANECRGDEPTEHAVEELADIVLRCLDMMVGLRVRRSSLNPNDIARHIIAPGNTDVPIHVSEAVCWTVAMSEPSRSLSRNLPLPHAGDDVPPPLELAWSMFRSLTTIDTNGANVADFGMMIRSAMYTAKMLGLPLDMAIVAKLRRNEENGNPKGRAV